MSKTYRLAPRSKPSPRRAKSEHRTVYKVSPEATVKPRFQTPLDAPKKSRQPAASSKVSGCKSGAFRIVRYPGKLEDTREWSIEPTAIPAKVYEALQITFASMVGVEPQVDPNDIEQFIYDGYRLFERGNGCIRRPSPLNDRGRQLRRPSYDRECESRS
jgi:hypothetical protein